MAEIRFMYAMNVKPDRVYEALTSQKYLAKWWTPHCVTDAAEGGTAKFEFPPHGDFCAFKIEKLQPYKLVEWICTDSSMMKTQEWNQTRIRFELSENKRSGTDLIFTHEGWKSKSECFAACTEGWHHFLESLKAYVETGKGMPFKENTGGWR